MYDQNIIEPKNLPMWTVAVFVVAALALTVAMTSLYRTTSAAVLTGAELVVLNQRIEVLNQQVNKSSSPVPTTTTKP